MVRRLFLLLAVLLCVSLPSWAEDRRIALLIGNSDYSSAVGELQNPQNDVDAMQAALMQAGFAESDIAIVRNAGRRDLMASVRDFAADSSDLKASDTAFFYYSGHGAKPPDRESTGLIPVDIENVDDDGFWFDTVDLNDDVIRVFQNANSQAAWVVVVDACRNELRLPSKNLGGGDKSFGVVPRSAGMLIAFAADSGQTARDAVSNATTGPYAKALSEEIVVPGRSLVSIFARVRSRVMELTGGAQEPVFSHRLNTELTLLAAAPVRSEEQATWDFAIRLNVPAAYRAYLDLYPNGQFRAEARARTLAAASTPNPEVSDEPIWRQFTEEEWSAAQSEVLLATAVEAHGTAKILQAADSGDYEAMILAAWLVNDGEHEIHRSVRQSVYYLERSCEAGRMRACVGLGIQHEFGDGVEQNGARAIALYRQACEEGNLAGCINLGIGYEKGEFLESDTPRSVELYQQACDGGSVQGCTYLGAAYESGATVESDVSQAIALYRQACAGGDMTACKTLGERYESGDGVQHDLSRAAGYFRQACEGDDMRSCLTLGFYHHAWGGVEQDLSGAAAYFRQVCAGKSQISCLSQGIRGNNEAAVQQDLSRSIGYFRQTCEGGEMLGCNILGIRYTFGVGVTANQSVAAAYFLEACSGGAIVGCANLGFFHENQEQSRQNLPLAITYYRRACEGGHRESCTALESLDAR